MSYDDKLIPSHRERRLVAEFGKALLDFHGDQRFCCYVQAYLMLLGAKLIREPPQGFTAFCHVQRFEPVSGQESQRKRRELHTDDDGDDQLPFSP